MKKHSEQARILAVIELKDVEKKFQHPQTIRVLKSVSMNIPVGQWATLMGPSGSGKSTLLSIIAGLDLPTSGEVWVANKRVDSLDENGRADFRAQSLGFVFQSFRLLPHLTVRENVELPFLIQGKGIDESAVDLLLTSVGLSHRSDHFPAQISGGEQQRTALARALVTRPPILLADEPTGNLDSRTGREILELMKKLQRELSCTLLVVTHDPLVREYSDRVFEMRDGMIGA